MWGSGKRLNRKPIEGDVRIPSGCAVSGIFNKKGKLFSGKTIIKSISIMRDRSNGLGGGFAAYGIYPDYKEFYALHIFFECEENKREVEQYLKENFLVEKGERIPTQKVQAIIDAPIIYRYFVKPRGDICEDLCMTPDEFMVRQVMFINSSFEGAYVSSSGKNMGAFKGVGYPEDIGEFYDLESYKGYLWTAHGRFPTNTPGWWGGAHPFTLLDWSVVHNGEISSYGTNRRYLEEFQYECSLQTDTEAATYLFDLLLRCHGLPLETACQVLAPPFWEEIERMSQKEKEIARALRMVYGKGLLNGPFSIILGSKSGMVAINDRIKLRPLVAAEQGDMLYVASEEAAIIEVCACPSKVWTPRAGQPVIGKLEEAESWVSVC